MAEVKSNNGTRTRGETNYNNMVFQGVQYKSVEETIDAGAKAYAKLAWGEVVNFTEEMKANGFEIPDTNTMAEMLVESKRKTIIASMQKRETMPSAFN